MLPKFRYFIVVHPYLKYRYSSQFQVLAMILQVLQKSLKIFFRSSILEERKYSFKNLKLTKATTVKVGNEAVKLKVS